MRSWKAGLRSALILACGFIPLRAADLEKFVAPGDTGKILLSVENDKDSEAPVTGARIGTAQDVDPRFSVESGSALGPETVSPAHKVDFSISYRIAPGAVEGTFPVVVTPRSETDGLVPGFETAVTTINFTVDGTPPTADAYDETGARITDGIGPRGVVTVRSSDSAPGSGIHRFSIWPGPYTEKIFTGPEAVGAGQEASFEYAGLPDGTYTVTVEDKAGNQKTVQFSVAGAPDIRIIDSNQEGNPRNQGPFTGSTVTFANRLWLHNGMTEPAGIKFAASSPAGVATLKVVGLNAAGGPDESKLYADLNVQALTQQVSFTDGTLPDAPGYLVSARAGSTTTVYFGVDSVPPVVSFGLNVSPTLEVVAVGISSDGTSGMAETVFMPGWPTPGDQSRVGSGAKGPAQTSFQLPIDQQEFVGTDAFGAPVLGAAGFVVARDVGGLAAAFNPIYVSREGRGFNAAGSLQYGSEWINVGWIDSTAATRLDEYHVGGNCVRRYPLPPACGGASPPAQCFEGAPSGPCGSWSFKIRAVGLAPSTTVPITVNGAFIGDTQIAAGAIGSTIPFSFSGAPGLVLGATVMARVDVVDGGNPYFTPGTVNVDGILHTLFVQASINPAAPVISTGIFPSVEAGDSLVYFGEVAAGPERRVWISQVPITPPAGQRFVPGNNPVATDIATMANFTGGVHVRLRFNGAALSASQAAQLKMWHRGPNGWEDVTTVVDVEHSEIWGESASASPFAVLIPSAALGTASAGAGSVSRLSSTAATLTWPAGDNPTGIRYFVTYTTSPAASPCAPDAGSVPGALSVFGETAQIGGLLPGSGYRFQVCNDALGAEGCNTPISVVTPQAGEPDVTSPVVLTCDGGAGSPDLTPPVTTLGFSGFHASTAGAAGIINANSSVTLSAVDLGVGQALTFYAVDPSSSVLAGGLNAGTTGAFSIYGGEFSLLPGLRLVAYGSVDGAGNYEILRSTIVVVEGPAIDDAPPTTSLSFGGYSTPAEGAAAFIYEITPVLLSSVDQDSGLARIYYSVDPSSSLLAAGLSAGTTGSFQVYADGGFTLAFGRRTLAYGAVDAAGNFEVLRSTAIEVGRPPSGGDHFSGGLSVGVDALGRLWSVSLDDQEVSLSRFDAAGVMASSAALADGIGDIPWAVLFDGESAYAVGSAQGSGMPAADVAVYKAAPDGGAVESRVLFDSGFANNDVVFDAKSPGWLVGMAQTSGPADLEVAGERGFSMALWKFDPALGTVQISTTFGRAGLDFGTGLSVDADGSLWIAGYSMRPGAPEVGGLDFALWHYAADGHTLLGGPFLKAGYLSDLDGEVTARVHVTSAAVYAAAPRLRASGGTDMAFLKFDKSSGQSIVESAWRPSDGSPSFPASILPEGAGMLVAGNVGAGAALWRFGYDGALQGVTTTEAGGVRGAVFKDSELWLSVESSTVPYRVEAEVAVAGSLIDLAPPRTSLSAGTPSFNGDSTVYVTSATPLGFAVIDDYAVPGDGLGVGSTQTFYAEAGGAYSRFTGSFALVAEGTHTVSFFSVDREGRVEAVKTQTVGVDLTAPVVTLVSSGSIFSIVAVDPVVAGAASGVGQIQYLLDHEADCDVEQSTAAAPGTCENLTYAGPFELVVGTHTIFYAATDRVMNGEEVTYSSFVTVGQPVMGPFVAPATGPIGIPFTIAGNGFGLYGGANTRVKFGTVAAPVSVWNNTTISGTIPGLSTGSYAVAVERQNASSVTSVSAGNFAVTDLNSAALNVSSGPIGVPFTITGTGFGPYAGTLSRVLIDGATAPLSVWNNTTITGTIPGVTPGAKTIVIQRAAGSFLSTSDGFAFEVTVPSVTAVSPSSGPIGAAYTLTGFSFGPYAGTNTRVLIGGATTALSLWSDRVIKGTVPGAVSPGVQTVVVQRLTAGGGFVESGAAYFQVAGLALANLTPSSGPIGVPFTISGTGFGVYDGANTRVRFGVSTAALSLWNDTTITGTIPALEPGAWPVVVERQQGSSVSTSSSATFTATALSVGVLSPSSGPIGVPFTITGSQFGVYGGANTRVKFNGVVAPVSVWNDSTITGTVPALSTGVAEVVVERQQGAFVAASGISSFTVVELAPAGMTPETGPIGTAFTITGSGFGPYNGANTRLMIGGVAASLSLWNDTTISGTIPDLPAGAQPLWLERSAGTGVQSSATNYFTVTTPAVASLTPSSAPIGAPFTLTGASFGAYGGANTRVTFNGVAAALSLWNDTTITGTVPALPAGVVDVVVVRQQGAGVVASSSSAFTVLDPAVGGLSPSAGPIGTAFTLTGSGFGPYAGANTRVLIGGAVAALSLWNDTTIKGTIPGLPAGTQAVWLERSSGSGVSSSATSYFNVTTPSVASLTPSSAPIGAPFTITGTSFGAYGGANTRVKFNGVAAPLSVWNDTQISGTVPGTLPPGDAEVIVERAAGAGLVVSATQAFYVLAPVISTVSPSFGPVGTVVTVTGAGFGPYSGSLTRLLVGGATVPLSVWNDTTIRWTVPSSLGDGEYPVVVERSPAGGTVTSASATFTVGTGYSGASFAFASTLSLAATPDTHFEGDMALSSATGGRIDTPAKAAVDIPPNAMEEDTEITLKRIKGDGLRAQAAEEIQKKAAGEPIEFGPEGTRFATPVTIELPYDPALTKDETQIAIHYYNPLRREWEELPSVVDRARKVVTAKTDHFSIYQPMGLAPTAASQDEFYFRDAYAFPNPSRGGSAVTFRIQPGLAETVEVRVYDLSGRKIHESSDFTFLGAIDDGNGKGAQNTYDHAWSVGGVGSGVYNFVIKASQRGNKPIVKSGKVGVIK